MTEDKQQKKRPKQPPLRMPKDLHVAYANLVRIAHTPSEMMYDFGRFLPGDPHAEVVSRVLMSPLGAKLFLMALTDNIAKYEKAFGEIKVPHKQTLADSLFRQSLTPPDGPPEGSPDGEDE